MEAYDATLIVLALIAIVVVLVVVFDVIKTRPRA